MKGPPDKDQAPGGNRGPEQSESLTRQNSAGEMLVKPDQGLSRLQSARPAAPALRGAL